MTEKDVEEAYNLFKNYESVIEKSKVVSIEDIKLKEYTLSVNSYIEKAPIEAICPQEVKKTFLATLDEVIEAEENLKSLLIEGGYISEH
ncbi:hypothetical protein D3C78_1486280 [compost metagenome]